MGINCDISGYEGRISRFKQTYWRSTLRRPSAAGSYGDYPQRNPLSLCRGAESVRVGLTLLIGVFQVFDLGVNTRACFMPALLPERQEAPKRIYCGAVFLAGRPRLL